MNEFKFSCPHCGQHIQCEPGWSGNLIPCPACQQDLLIPKPQPDSVASAECDEPLAQDQTRANMMRSAIVTTVLVLLGVITPFLLAAAVMVTFFLGPLALVAGPIAGVMVARGVAVFCREWVGPRWFWLYVGSAAATFAIILVPAFLHRHSHGSGQPTMEAALAATYGTGPALLLIGGCALLWLIGLLTAIPSAR